MRAAVVNQHAFVGRRRRAGDCPPYQFGFSVCQLDLAMICLRSFSDYEDENDDEDDLNL